MELGLKIEDALKVNKDLEKYVFYKDGKPKIDFKNKEALYHYNKAILKELFSIELEFHADALIPTPINRFMFVKNVFNKFNATTEGNGIKKVLEIGTGSGIISIMIAKYYGCEVYATETIDDYIRLATENVGRNNLSNKIKIINSRGKIINGIEELENEKFDLIISYPPFYGVNSVPSKRSFGGALATDVELIGGGKYGEEFSLKIIEEGINYLNKNGLIAIMFPHKPLERRILVEDKIKEVGLKLEKDEIKTGKRIRHIIKGRLCSCSANDYD